MLSQANSSKHLTIFCSFLIVPHASHVPLNTGKVTETKQGPEVGDVPRRRGRQGGEWEGEEEEEGSDISLEIKRRGFWPNIYH